MDAKSYQLDDMRSRLRTHTHMTPSSHWPMASDGLGVLIAVTSFWASFAVGITSSHARTLSASWSVLSRLPQALAKP